MENLDAVAKTPAAALGSVRMKPTKEDFVAMIPVLKKFDIKFFFYIGGNDSAETAHIVNENAKEQGYDMKCFHIPKTIDNDLRVTDHCPGYASAARFVAHGFQGDDRDLRAMGGCKINICMGRDAGWLTAASVLGRRPVRAAATPPRQALAACHAHAHTGTYPDADAPRACMRAHGLIAGPGTARVVALGRTGGELGW
jgi:6-phosphofructokinase